MDLAVRVIIALFAAIGVVAAGHGFLTWFMKCKKDDVRDIAIIVRMKSENGKKSCEYALRSLLFCSGGVATERGAPRICVYDAELNDESREVCKKIAAESGRVFLIKDRGFDDNL